jgi:hypothetical protein
MDEAERRVQPRHQQGEIGRPHLNRERGQPALPRGEVKELDGRQRDNGEEGGA